MYENTLSYKCIHKPTIHMFVYVYIYMCIYVFMYTYMYTCMYVYMCICMYIHSVTLADSALNAKIVRSQICSPNMYCILVYQREYSHFRIKYLIHSNTFAHKHTRLRKQANFIHTCALIYIHVHTGWGVQ